ncbi:MAG: aldehyde ferredoxin oxidoreductase family protein [Desulfobacterales bacterium]|nr:aldehyde ferredoxin oxidoreductase family protein [Desulfobacterales bacterium]
MKTYGYHGRLLDVNLSTGKISDREVSAEDREKFIGGRGLGTKVLWDTLKKPGISYSAPEVPLMFMPGPFSGLPVPSASRTCVVTKSPCTSPVESDYPFASTTSYSNIGGFFGPEIRFAGYDGIVVTGKASSPVYLVLNNGKAEIRDAKKFWGMNTDEFDKQILNELKDRRFRTCYIGPAGENLVSYACILHTATRAAGRGVGCVMGAKNLKAIAVKGSEIPEIADLRKFWGLVEDMRKGFRELFAAPGFNVVKALRNDGTAAFLKWSSDKGLMSVRNFREATYTEVEKIGAAAAREKIWLRESACYCCPVACKKGGVVKKGAYAGVVHDSPEYETGTMFGANLMISNIEGMTKAIFDGDDYGMDIISAGNVIGFLMEAYEKKYIDKAFLDGVDLKWGNVDAVRTMIGKIAKRDGVGDLAAKGVKAVSKEIGKDSDKFAIHVKGLELAAWNVQANPGRGLCYATSTKGACHQSGDNTEEQDFRAMIDSSGLCRFITYQANSSVPNFKAGMDCIANLLAAVTGIQWTKEKVIEAGERIFNLEKMFNYREGFKRKDDWLPERFFTEPLTIGPAKGAVLKKEGFNKMLDDYYKKRGWNPETSEPAKARLEKLGLPLT